jgi:hypothetical protein
VKSVPLHNEQQALLIDFLCYLSTCWWCYLLSVEWLWCEVLYVGVMQQKNVWTDVTWENWGKFWNFFKWKKIVQGLAVTLWEILIRIAFVSITLSSYIYLSLTPVLKWKWNIQKAFLCNTAKKNALRYFSSLSFFLCFQPPPVVLCGSVTIHSRAVIDIHRLGFEGSCNVSRDIPIAMLFLCSYCRWL